MNHSRSKRFMTAALAALLVAGVPASALGAESGTVIPEATTTSPAMPAPAMPPRPDREALEPRITEEQALAALREFFTLPEKGSKFDYQVNLSREGERLVWRVEGTYREQNSTMGFGLGAVDAITGLVIQYSGAQMIPQPIRTGPLANVKSRDDAKARAEALLKKVVPHRFANLREGGPWTSAYYYAGIEDRGDTYQFVFTEYVDDIPFPSSSVTVGVHKQTLEYMSLYVGLQEGLTFQPGPAKVTPEEALKVYQTEVTPKLGYHTITAGFPYGYARPSEVKLLYSLDNMWRSVDAMTGTWAEEPNYNPGLPEAGNAPAQPEPVPAGDVTPVKAAVLPLTQSTAREFAAQLLGLRAVDLRTDDYGYSDEALYRFSKHDEEGSVTIALDPKTGLIRNAWRYSNRPPKMAPAVETVEAGDPQPAPEPAVTAEQEEQAKQTAIAVVQTYFSDLRDQLLLSADPYWTDNPEQPTRRFRFIRQVNGLEVPNDAIYVSVDLTTMQWQDISANLTMGLPFPDPAGVISAEKARDAALAGREPMLIYRPVYPQMSQDGPYYGPMPQPTEAQLVYVLRPEPYSGLIDAFTGEPGALGSLATLEEAMARVDGHWAEGEFHYFLGRSAIVANRLDPEGPLSRSLAVALLLARSQQFDYYPYGTTDLPFSDIAAHEAFGLVRTAWNQGWLSPVGGETAFRPDEAVTRAEFAVWAARALGLGALARSESLVVTDAFADLGGLTVEQRNAVNFLHALGLIGRGESFRGNEAMTQAEGVALTARIFNFLLQAK